MRSPPTYRYSAYGNRFLLVDELAGVSFGEGEKSAYARMVLDPTRRQGLDNLIVLQACSRGLLAEIQATREYWRELPEPVTDVVFRMFEPDGSEAYSCGNGMLCAAQHLSEVHDRDTSSTLTELPTAAPRARILGVTREPAGFQVQLGRARQAPPASLSMDGLSPPLPQILCFPGLKVPSVGLAGGETLELTGHFTFTGEPHLVVLQQAQTSHEARRLCEIVLGQPDGGPPPHDPTVFRRLGLAINQRHRGRFPQGVNFSMARLENDEVIGYRCFERGIYRETLACGTAAVAIASVLRHRRDTPSDSLTLHPLRSRREPAFRDARVQVTQSQDGQWWLRGLAPYVFREQG